MDTINPINLNNGTIHIHGLRKVDMQRLSDIEKDIFEILSNPENVKYLPERHITNKEDASKLLLGVTLGYATKSRWTHFLSLVMLDYKVVGQIDIISPNVVEVNYGIKNLWMIEYFLHKDLWNKGIMASALSALLLNLKEQGITNIAALCQRENLSSVKLLAKIGFKKQSLFDTKQDLFTLT